MSHELKTWPEFFAAVKTHSKRVELRKADRDFRVGDQLVLSEFDPQTQSFSGDRCFRRVTHIVPGGQFGLESGFVAMSIAP